MSKRAERRAPLHCIPYLIVSYNEVYFHEKTPLVFTFFILCAPAPALFAHERRRL